MPEPAVAEIAELLADHVGMRLLSVHPDLVVAERPVRGEITKRRRIGLQWDPERGWRAGMAIITTEPGTTHWKADRIADTTLTDLEDFGRWLGAWLSKPVSAAEVAAIEAGVA